MSCEHQLYLNSLEVTWYGLVFLPTVYTKVLCEFEWREPSRRALRVVEKGVTQGFRSL